jgi:hypothetical protein
MTWLENFFKVRPAKWCALIFDLIDEYNLAVVVCHHKYPAEPATWQNRQGRITSTHMCIT